MNRKYLTVILILCVILFAGSAWPDFGNFSGNTDYSSSHSSSSSSGNSDRSSSSRSSSSRSSSGSSSWGNNVTLPITYGISSIASSHESEEDEEFENTCAGGVFFLLVAYFIWKIIASKRHKQHSEPIIIHNREPERVLNHMNQYSTLDPLFNPEKLRAMIGNLYVQMQDTWHNKDISSLRPYFTDEFYSQMNRQLEEFRRTGRTDYTERIAVLSVSLQGWYQSGGMDYIVVGLRSRIVSYVLDDRTGRLVSGDMNREKFMEYELELSRKTGTVTNPEGDDIKTETCPHCGAPLNLNASAQCEYCGSVITRVNTNWAVSSMKGISQRTA